MTHCYDDGALRAYLDDALPAAERAALVLHLGGCGVCQRQLRAVASVAARAATLLAVPDAPDAHAALARFQRDARRPMSNDRPTPNAQRPTTNARRCAARRPTASRIPYQASKKEPMSIQNISRRWLGAAAALVVALALLALPPVRAAADQLLQVFRVQNVVFVPVSQDRMQQLKNLNFDKDTLFIAKPKVVNSPAAPRTVANVQEASSAVNFPVALLSSASLASITPKIVVEDRRVLETQINVEAARQVLKLMQVDDVTLPDALGAKPISADAPPSVAITYDAPGYQAELVQGRSPTVTLPESVDMQQLGKAVLRLLGTEATQAEAMSKQIDWSSTFVVPFPADVTTMRQVTINGAKGMLVTAREGKQRGTMIYWQQADRFFVLRAHGGINDADLLALAESVR